MARFFSRLVRNSLVAPSATRRARQSRRFESLERRELFSVSGPDENWAAIGGSVQDATTGLVWSGKREAQNGNYPYSFNWANNLDTDGFDDWRLPTRDELEEAVAHDLCNHAQEMAFGSWTSTSLRYKGVDSHYYVQCNGTVGWASDVGSLIPVTAVRGVRTPATFTAPHVRVFTQNLTLGEWGEEARFSVALDTAPTANVTIGVSSTDTTVVTVSVSSFTFTPTNWNIPQHGKVTALEDNIVDGDVALQIALANAVSADPNYNGLDVPDIDIIVTDATYAGLNFTAVGTAPLVTTESGGTASVAVSLTAQPIGGPVYVTVNSTDASEGAGQAAPLVFDATNWNVPQTAFITGLADGAADGDVGYNVNAAVVAGSSPEFAGLTSAPLTVTNVDQDGTVITYASGSINRAIPDHGSTTSSITIGSAALIGDLDVTVNISHARDSELRLTLIGPNGQSVLLVSGQGGAGANFTNTRFNDEAAQSIVGAVAPFTGSFRPQSGALSNWDGNSAAGSWTLKVEDTAKRNTGTLLNWSLHVREESGAASMAAPSGNGAVDALAIDHILSQGTESVTPKRLRRTALAK